ncbi:MAG: hypothetical protein ACQES9_13655 [Myxococcota bacterium]
MLYLITAIIVIFIIWVIYQIFKHLYLLIYLRHLVLVFVVLVYANYFAQKKGYDFLRLFGTSTHELRVFQLRSTWKDYLKPGFKDHKDFKVKIVKPIKGEKVYITFLCNNPDTEDELCTPYVKRFH